jgi:hypothetical protein
MRPLIGVFANAPLIAGRKRTAAARAKTSARKRR